MNYIAISSLPVATSADVADILPIVQGGVTKQLTNSLLFTSPTLVTPVLGTPVSGNLINCTGLPVSGGGTGATTAAQARTNLGIGDVVTGMIAMWATATAPTGYVLCNGASLDTTTYANLFAVIGYTFGGSSANFNVPDYRNNFPIGSGTHALAATGGSADAVVISHTHSATSTSSVTDPGHVHPPLSPATSFTGPPNNSQGLTGAPQQATNMATTGTAVTGVTVATTTTNAATGVSGTGLNLPPYLAINFIIKT